jgi:hypothetical protein
MLFCEFGGVVVHGLVIIVHGKLLDGAAAATWMFTQERLLPFLFSV